jgi:hypothetical protein
MTEFSAMALPAFSSLASIRACAFVPELRSYTAHERGVKNICFLFYTSGPQNPLRYFYGLLIRLFSDWKRKGSIIHCVNLCDIPLMS